MSSVFEAFFVFVCGCPHTVCDKVFLDDSFIALGFFSYLFGFLILVTFFTSLFSFFLPFCRLTAE